jgi:Putative, 10TM heavy-metal exporter
MIEVVKHAVMITSFVFVMMLVIEYLNVLTSGAWQKRLIGHKWGQYVFAAILGAIPGCLGAFAVVAMYSHRIITFGAVVTAMIATSGDESFVMLALIPKQALFVTLILFVLSILTGILTDIVAGKHRTRQPPCSEGFEVHEQELCECFPRGQIFPQWKECIASRGILAVVLTVFVIVLITGQVGPANWTWVRVTLLVASSVALFIVSTVPDHFLEEHLWRHVVRKHVPQVFLWTFGVLLFMYILGEGLHIDLKTTLSKGKWIVLLVACLVGLIPESGPHLIFVTLYAQGTIPFSILLASSIVQDGHGMLPMLAHSRQAFLGIKAVNFAAGIFFGGMAMIMNL